MMTRSPDYDEIGNTALPDSPNISGTRQTNLARSTSVSTNCFWANRSAHPCPPTSRSSQDFGFSTPTSCTGRSPSNASPCPGTRKVTD